MYSCKILRLSYNDINDEIIYEFRETGRDKKRESDKFGFVTFPVD